MTGATPDEPQALRRSQEGESRKIGRTKIREVLGKPNPDFSTQHLSASRPPTAGRRSQIADC
jgi:hypothetical protein